MLCGSAPAVMADGAATEHEQMLNRAGKLLVAYKDSEALALYEQVLKTDADNYEALCKASYLHCRIGDRYTDETSKSDHFEQARNLALRAYALAPEDAEANYVMALALGSSAMIAGPKQRLATIYQVKPFIDKALACDNQHAGAWYILGRWYFKVANLNIAEQAAAKVFFGGIEEKPTNQDAADALTNAIRYNPDNIRYYYDLACVYEEMKDKEACIHTLQQALTVNLETKDELELSRRCKIMMQEVYAKK
ncbi:tetratricopeptide repeat protein [Pontibacter liquoris]|uniref:tetratricopeptide repeat protein n=1 Tax=Pontibacter liquoris TaxID=2905677 RepID=UPI001FA7548A|nr:hypothetical protein [Pontibacter liquoris]